MTRENKFRVGTADVAQAVRPVELTIKGDVEVLRLQPGDRIVVTLHGRYRADDIEDIHERLRQEFPDNKVIVVEGSSVSLAIQRTEP